MGPVLNGLIKLQSVENRLRAAKSKLTRCRRNVIIQENMIRTLQGSLDAKREELQLGRLQADRLELELKTRDDSIAKLRASLNVAKTNKEYAVVLTQLNTSRADNSKIETQILEMFKDIETDEAECNDLQKQVEEQKDKLEQIRKDSEISAVKFEKEIEEIQMEWNLAAKDIPAEPLEIFNRVAETYDGEAIATIEGLGNGNGPYSCGGCFMGITAETVNLLLTKDDIIRCPNCTRILCLDRDHEE
ncbi:MAG TPA: C4-type zinc ribbon domain-containing protein [Sedimentisphaerales bacterium]|nr:C4-type zinc ribbon domain-containing protein [Sedimentisphaerales bacterium]